MSKKSLRALGVVAAVWLMAAAQAAGQASDDSVARIQARLQQGDRITVTDTSGRSVSGVLVGVSADAVQMRGASGPIAIKTQEVEEVRKRGDSPWNGLLLGAALGATLGFATYEECDPVPAEHVCGGNLTTSRGMETAVVAALFGGIGLSVDILMQGTTTTYRAPARTPAGFRVGISRSQVGAQFGMRF
jgi:hypothetical protein